MRATDIIIFACLVVAMTWGAPQDSGISDACTPSEGYPQSDENPPLDQYPPSDHYPYSDQYPPSDEYPQSDEYPPSQENPHYQIDPYPPHYSQESVPEPPGPPDYIDYCSAPDRAITPDCADPNENRCTVSDGKCASPDYDWYVRSEDDTKWLYCQCTDECDMYCQVK